MFSNCKKGGHWLVRRPPLRGSCGFWATPAGALVILDVVWYIMLEVPLVTVCDVGHHFGGYFVCRVGCHFGIHFWAAFLGVIFLEILFGQSGAARKRERERERARESEIERRLNQTKSLSCFFAARCVDYLFEILRSWDFEILRF